MKTIIDTHTHLYDLSDPVTVLQDCAAAGVTDVIALGVDLASNQKHLELKRTPDTGPVLACGSRKGQGHQTPEHSWKAIGINGCQVSSVKCPDLHIALGLHPGNITNPADTDACFAFMREHILDAIAIGETGLDFWYKWARKDEAKKREQREVFDRHLSLAREAGLPIVIHSRGAWRDCFDMAKSAGINKAEFHWYSGPVEVLKDILDAGFYISCTPSLAYSLEARRAVVAAPLERILVETDTPVAYKVETPDTGHKTPESSGKAIGLVGCQVSGVRCPDQKIPSVPKDVWRTLKLLSEIKGRPEDDVLAIVNANARSFFNI